MKSNSSQIESDAIRNRFLANMKRVNALASLPYKKIEALTPTSVFESHGVVADILRASVAYLHATTEDYIRCRLGPRKKFTFNSKSDVKQALNRLGVDSSLFDELSPGLAQLAARRIRIVHYADLGDDHSESVKHWDIADIWQLIHWLLCVMVFFYRLEEVIGATNMVRIQARKNCETAMKQHVEFWRALIAFPSVSPEGRKEKLLRIADKGDEIISTLKLDIQMFIDAEGRVIDGAI